MSATDTRTDLGAFVCVIEELHRDLATADAACVGRFTHAEVTLDLGTSPDWIGGGLADDEEWRIEWVKPTRASTSRTGSSPPGTRDTCRHGRTSRPRSASRFRSVTTPRT
ncbi:MAG: hypothetical protein R2710_03485 [Acidimicrobiales bacterium]